MSALDDHIREIQQLAKQRDDRLSTAAVPASAIARSGLLAFQLGTRVLDLVTGEEGTVVDGKRENVFVSSARSAGS